MEDLREEETPKRYNEDIKKLDRHESEAEMKNEKAKIGGRMRRKNG